MKKYVNPTICVMTIESAPLLAGSPDGVSNSYSNSVQLSRESAAWEDEE